MKKPPMMTMKRMTDKEQVDLFDVVEYYVVGLSMGLPIERTARMTLRQFNKLYSTYMKINDNQTPRPAPVGGHDPIDVALGGL
jgi:hypothetical protein